MRGLGGRTYIVTGAASGIGRATAARLLDEGARVDGSRPRRPPDDVAEGKDESGRWAFTHVDVTDEASVAALVRAAVAFGGGVDGLVNAAGVAGGGPVHMLPADEWARVIAVNLTGTFLTAKHVIAQLLTQPARADGQRGSVVTVASIEGLEGTAGGSAYSASKGGVVILTKNMAIDYAGRGIRVNAICPGFIETPMTDSVFGPGHGGGAGRHRCTSTSWAGAWAGPRRSRRRRPSCSRTTPRSSRAMPCRSTAATPPAGTTASPTCSGSPAPSAERSERSERSAQHQPAAGVVEDDPAVAPSWSEPSRPSMPPALMEPKSVDPMSWGWSASPGPTRRRCARAGP